MRPARNLLFVLFLMPGLPAADLSPADREFFENRIRPVLVEQCTSCHSGERPQGALRLDFRGGWEKGGKSGPALVRGEPGKSPLIRAIRHEGAGMAMPLGGKRLAPEVIAAFEQWVTRGAPDPRDAPVVARVNKSWAATFEERRKWWSLQPVTRPPVPAVNREAWSSQPVDRFILAKLEAQSLAPAEPADRATLLRRLSFVLTGLPPAPEEVDAFVKNPSPDAYRRQVDRLLASPHFGERWARHWMDVVRYSDTYGYEWDIPAKGAWRYRDYLIRAFNGDVPWDQLVREQIAGDLLPHPRVNPADQINESMAGPMFFQMGENRHGDSLQFNGIHQEMLNNKIDAFSKAFQAATVGCARCHDHRLDAISQRDYYALGGMFMSARWVTNTLDLPDRNRDLAGQLETMKTPVRDRVTAWWIEGIRDSPRYLRAAQACVDNSPDAERLAEGLDRRRLEAWKRALAVAPGTKPPLEDPLRAWFDSHHGGAGEVRKAWGDTARMYQKAREERAAANARDYTVLADFREATPPGWSVDGVGLRDGRVTTGDFAVATDGSAAVAAVFPAGLFTNRYSPRMNGAVRTPYLDHLGKKYVSLEIAGGDFAAHRLIADNAFLTERQVYLKDIHPTWATLSSTAYEKGNRAITKDEEAQRRVYVEVVTKTSNPNFPPRVNLGGKCTDEQAADPKSWFGITRVVLHDKPEPPADGLSRFQPLFQGEAPADLEAVAARYRDWLTGSLRAWSEGRANEDDVRLINWMIERGLLPNRLDERPTVRERVAEYRAVERRVATPQTVNGMADLDAGDDYRLNVRGVYEDLGERVPRGYLEVLTGRKDGLDGTGSRRLALADIVASPKNPLTARVFVNRVWHWLFGTGIVSTTDDFGHLGERPSHPELLDYLASTFVERGWSVKTLVRSIVLSETFRQSGQMSARGREADPLNRLLHHYPVRRLEAEAIRDSLLWTSTRLDDRIFGEPLNPARSNEDPEKRLFSGPLDGQGRRSIYVKMTIMEPPKFLATFNQPSPKIPTGRRDVTNVPAQALALLNDPFVEGQAEYWARQLLNQPHRSPEERLTTMFRRAFGRNPQPDELMRWRKAVDDFAGLYQDVPGKTPPGGMMNSLAVWKDVAHAIFNTKEFLYVR
ncbi:MAG: PSD1 and planctomycete cytochrome C domain-containing protein [Bryobacteraceae bacterium]